MSPRTMLRMLAYGTAGSAGRFIRQREHEQGEESKREEERGCQREKEKSRAPHYAHPLGNRVSIDRHEPCRPLR